MRPAVGAITAPTVFTHGASDPFGSITELRAAVALIPAGAEIVEVAGVGHDLGFSARVTKVPDVVATAVDAALRRMTRHVHSYAEAVLAADERSEIELPADTSAMPSLGN